MEHPSFTEQEERAVAQVLFWEPKKKSLRLLYFVGLLPSMLMAGYSVWVQDWRAALISYIALLIIVSWYLNNSYENAKHLWSAVKKYEAAVGALQKAKKTDA